MNERAPQPRVNTSSTPESFGLKPIETPRDLLAAHTHFLTALLYLNLSKLHPYVFKDHVSPQLLQGVVPATVSQSHADFMNGVGDEWAKQLNANIHPWIQQSGSNARALQTSIEARDNIIKEYIFQDIASANPAITGEHVSKQDLNEFLDVSSALARDRFNRTMYTVRPEIEESSDSSRPNTSSSD